MQKNGFWRVFGGRHCMICLHKSSASLATAIDHLNTQWLLVVYLAPKVGPGETLAQARDTVDYLLGAMTARLTSVSPPYYPGDFLEPGSGRDYALPSIVGVQIIDTKTARRVVRVFYEHNPDGFVPDLSEEQFYFTMEFMDLPRLRYPADQFMLSTIVRPTANAT